MKIIDFLPLIQGDLPSCPDETMRLAVVRALQHFCKRTLAWDEWLDPIALQHGGSDYDVEPPAGALTISIAEVWCGQRQLEPKDPMEIARRVVPGLTSNEPVYFTTDARQTITVYPVPAAPTQSLRIRAVYMPTLSATSIPDEIAHFHGEVLEAGAKGALMLQPGKPWTDQKTGEYWDRKFRSGVEDAAITKSHGNVPASTTVRPRRFGFTR